MAWYVCLSLNQFKNPVVNLIFESSLTLRKATLLVSVTDGRITKPTGKRREAISETSILHQATFEGL
jgi:hypothetical protein